MWQDNCKLIWICNSVWIDMQWLCIKEVWCWFYFLMQDQESPRNRRVLEVRIGCDRQHLKKKNILDRINYNSAITIKHTSTTLAKQHLKLDESERSSCSKRLPVLERHNRPGWWAEVAQRRHGAFLTQQVRSFVRLLCITTAQLNFVACMHRDFLLTTDFRILTRGLGIGLEGLFSKLSGRVEEWPPFRACSASW